MNRADFLKRLILGFGLVNVLTALIVITPLFQSFQLLQQKAQREASGLAQLMERTVSDTIEQIDIVLQTCAEEIEQQLAAGVDHKAINALIQRQYKHLPELNVLRVVDETGQALYGVGPSLESGGLNIADRDYFILARDSRWPTLSISRPLSARTTAERSVFLARRINRPDGSFGGIVYTAIPVARFQLFFRSLYLGPKSSVALIDHEKNLVARHPETEVKDMSTLLPLAERMFNAVQQHNPDDGVFSIRSPFDGVERIIAYRKVSNFPGHLFVGLATDDYFATWRTEFTTMLVLLALILTTSGITSRLLFIGWKRQHELNQHLDRQSRTDALTGCANRRHILEALEKERQRSLRYGKPFSVLALDLDHFKSVNDRFGHPAGDEALRHFVEVAGNSLRALDTIGRLGGEEFLVLLPETPMESAVKTAERIRLELEATPVPLTAAPLTLTVSIGVTAWTGDEADTMEKLLFRADSALYKAKEAGRNQVQTEG